MTYRMCTERTGGGKEGRRKEGKEKKGKERKGKERKGKERKGKERKGKRVAKVASKCHIDALTKCALHNIALHSNALMGLTYPKYLAHPACAHTMHIHVDLCSGAPPLAAASETLDNSEDEVDGTDDEQEAFVGGDVDATKAAAVTQSSHAT